MKKNKNSNEWDLSRDCSEEGELSRDGRREGRRESVGVEGEGRRETEEEGREGPADAFVTSHSVSHTQCESHFRGGGGFSDCIH